ncbi:MAG: hypothetical protein ACHQK8_04245, partial [Bacteroidia bacterium]
MLKKENGIYFLPVLFSFTQVFILSLMFLAARAGFDFHAGEVIRSAGLAVFLLMTPFYLSRVLRKNKEATWFNGISFLLICCFICIVAFGFSCDFFELHIGYFLPALGFILLFKFLSDYINSKHFYTDSKKIMLPAIVLGLWTTGNIWGWGFQNPLYFEGMALGKGHIDMLYLSSLSQMIKTYFVPSLGIDGLILRHYHFGSNVVAASFSSLADIPVIQFYQITFPLILTSLFSFSFLNLVKRISEISNPVFKWNPAIFWIYVIGIIGIFPEKVELSFVVLKNIFASESYSLALSFAFLSVELFLTFLISVKYKAEHSPAEKAFLLLIIPVLFFLVGITKVSVVFLLIAAFVYFLFRFGLYKKKVFIFSTLLSFVAFAIVLQIVSGFSSTRFSPFSFVKDYATGNRVLFFPFYFAFPVLYFLVRIRHSGIKKFSGLKQIIPTKPFQFFDLELILLFVIAGALPGILFYIHGGGAGYFSDIQRWVCLILLMVMVLPKPELLHFRKNLFSVLIYAYFFFVVGSNTFTRIKSFAVLNYRIRNEILQNSPGIKTGSAYKLEQILFTPGKLIKDNLRYRMFTELVNLDRLSRKEKSQQFVSIPKSDSFWHSMPVENISFVVPALSGMAMISGTPPVSWKERHKYEIFSNYGFADYRFE